MTMRERNEIERAEERAFQAEHRHSVELAKARAEFVRLRALVLHLEAELARERAGVAELELSE